MGKLTFAFKGNASEQVIKLLPLHHKVILESSLEAVDTFIEDLILVQPETILGLGEYSGPDTDAIRIETAAWNKFRNNSIELGAAKILKIRPFIKPTENMKITQGLGNSWCNLISYKIQEKINTGELHSEYTFLHIPKSYPIERAAQELEKYTL